MTILSARQVAAQTLLLEHIQKATSSTSRVAASRTYRALPGDDALIFGGAKIRLSGVDKMVEQWVREDRAGRKAGGRPPTVSIATYLMILAACAEAHLPLSHVSIHHVATSEMTRDMREYLGFPVSKDRKTDKALNKRRKRMTSDCVRRTAKTVGDTMDPARIPHHRGLTPAELDELDAARDPEDDARRQLRADEFVAAYLHADWQILPSEAQAAYKGHVTVDATFVGVFGQKKGHRSSRRAVQGAWSQENIPYWTTKTQADSRDIKDTGKQAYKTQEGWRYGFDAHLTALTGEGVGKDFPGLVAGMRLDRPGVTPGLNIAASLQQLHRLGMPKGLVTCDLGYSQTAPENFALPVRALDYGMHIMYKNEDLGQQAVYKGARLVEGTLYGPCIPETLVNASIEYADRKITYEEYQLRLEERSKYAMRLKSLSNNKASFTFRCPAQGPGFTARCQKRPDSMTRAPGQVRPGKRKSLLLIVDPPKADFETCTNAESISIPMEEIARFYQELEYGSPKWATGYKNNRNQIEGLNRLLKNEAGTGIGLVDQRRFRGYGKQVVALTAKIGAVNSAKILSWQEKRHNGEVDPTPSRAGRPTTSVMKKVRRSAEDTPYRVADRKRPAA